MTTTTTSDGGSSYVLKSNVSMLYHTFVRMFYFIYACVLKCVCMCVRACMCLGVSMYNMPSYIKRKYGQYKYRKVYRLLIKVHQQTTS